MLTSFHKVDLIPIGEFEALSLNDDPDPNAKGLMYSDRFKIPERLPNGFLFQHPRSEKLASRISSGGVFRVYI